MIQAEVINLRERVAKKETRLEVATGPPDEPAACPRFSLRHILSDA